MLEMFTSQKSVFQILEFSVVLIVLEYIFYKTYMVFRKYNLLPFNKKSNKKLSDYKDANLPENLDIGYASDIGKREYQQDTIYIPSRIHKLDIEEKGYFTILCDGMGGMEHGDIASKTACREIAAAYYGGIYRGTFKKVIEQIVHTVDKAIAGIKNSHGKKANTGTTMICSLVKDNKLLWASVGDSRIYHVRDNNIRMMTRDHNYALQLISSGVSEEEAFNNPKSQALISYIGMGAVRIIDVGSCTNLEDQDVILMCSDGVYGTLYESKIVEIINKYKDNMSLCANMLISEVLEMDKNGQDNTSAIVMKYKTI